MKTKSILFIFVFLISLTSVFAGSVLVNSSGGYPQNNTVIGNTFIIRFQTPMNIDYGNLTANTEFAEGLGDVDYIYGVSDNAEGASPSAQWTTSAGVVTSTTVGGYQSAKSLDIGANTLTYNPTDVMNMTCSCFIFNKVDSANAARYDFSAVPTANLLGIIIYGTSFTSPACRYGQIDWETGNTCTNIGSNDGSSWIYLRSSASMSDRNIFLLGNNFTTRDNFSEAFGTSIDLWTSVSGGAGANYVDNCKCRNSTPVRNLSASLYTFTHVNFSSTFSVVNVFWYAGGSPEVIISCNNQTPSQKITTNNTQVTCSNSQVSQQLTAWVNYTTGTSNTTTVNITVSNVALDTTPPTIPSISINASPKIGDTVQFAANCSDETGLFSCIAAHNLTGSFVNQTPSLGGAGQLILNLSLNLTNTLKRNSVIGVRFTANDTSGNMVQSSILTATVADSPPTFTIANNNTNPKINENVQLSSLTYDNDTLSMIIASWNCTSGGSWLNISNSTINTSPLNYTVNSTVLGNSGICGFLFYSNDSVVSTFTASSINTFTIKDTIPPTVNITNQNASIGSIASDILTTYTSLGGNNNKPSSSCSDYIFTGGLMPDGTTICNAFNGTNWTNKIVEGLGTFSSTSTSLNITPQSTSALYWSSNNSPRIGVGVMCDFHIQTSPVVNSIVSIVNGNPFGDSGRNPCSSSTNHNQFCISPTWKSLTIGNSTNGSTNDDSIRQSDVNYTVNFTSLTSVRMWKNNTASNTLNITTAQSIAMIGSGSNQDLFNFSFLSFDSGDVSNPSTKLSEIRCYNGTTGAPQSGLFNNIMNINTRLNISAFSTGSPSTLNFSLNITGNNSLSYFAYSYSSANVWDSQNFTLNVTGFFNASVIACDSAGNCEINSTTFLVIDNSIPAVNITNINGTTPIKFNDVVNISGYVTDNALTQCYIFTNMTGINATTYPLSGTSGVCSKNFTINMTRGNAINFIINATDGINTGTNSTTITVANTPDNNSVVILSPLNNSVILNTNPVSFNATYARDADGDTINISWFINGKLNQTSLGNTTFNASDGVYILNVSISDGFSNSINATINFTINAFGINISLNAPKNNTIFYSGTNIFFNFTVNFSTAIDKCFLFINGSSNSSNYTKITTNIDYNLTANLSQNQDYKWNIGCNNTGGSQINSTFFVVLIYSYPNISFTVPTLLNNSITTNNYVPINVTTIGKIDKYVLDWNGTNETITSINSTSGILINKSGLNDLSIYFFKVYVNDTNGNWNNTEKRLVNINLLGIFATISGGINFTFRPNVYNPTVFYGNQSVSWAGNNTPFALYKFNIINGTETLYNNGTKINLRNNYTMDYANGKISIINSSNISWVTSKLNLSYDYVATNSTIRITNISCSGQNASIGCLNISSLSFTLNFSLLFNITTDPVRQLILEDFSGVLNWSVMSNRSTSINNQSLANHTIVCGSLQYINYTGRVQYRFNNSLGLDYKNSTNESNKLNFTFTCPFNNSFTKILNGSQTNISGFNFFNFSWRGDNTSNLISVNLIDGTGTKVSSNPLNLLNLNWNYSGIALGTLANITTINISVSNVTGTLRLNNIYFENFKLTNSTSNQSQYLKMKASCSGQDYHNATNLTSNILTNMCIVPNGTTTKYIWLFQDLNLSFKGLKWKLQYNASKVS